MHVTAEDFIKVYRGPAGIVRACTLCKHFELVKRGAFGRGYGFREGNKARGRMIQHVKEAHPEALNKEAS